jgi:hypothetical protein
VQQHTKCIQTEQKKGVHVGFHVETWSTEIKQAMDSHTSRARNPSVVAADDFVRRMVKFLGDSSRRRRYQKYENIWCVCVGKV